MTDLLQLDSHVALATRGTLFSQEWFDKMQWREVGSRDSTEKRVKQSVHNILNLIDGAKLLCQLQRAMPADTLIVAMPSIEVDRTCSVRIDRHSRIAGAALALTQPDQISDTRSQHWLRDRVADQD
uniref:hypothetical protein n=1 Tax=Herbaspirillum frisingense TaxID=92645 RepID=UPI00286BAB12|nr:hypothetical protein [Herbaspirillum frisingense]